MVKKIKSSSPEEFLRTRPSKVRMKNQSSQTIESVAQTQLGKLRLMPGSPLKKIDFQFDPMALMDHRAQRHLKYTYERSGEAEAEQSNQKLLYILPCERINILYQYLVHLKTKKHISDELGYKYSTVVNIIQSFDETGRMFKLLPNHSKSFILKHRVESLQSQRLYKQIWKKHYSKGQAVIHYKTAKQSNSAADQMKMSHDDVSDGHDIEKQKKPLFNFKLVCQQDKMSLRKRSSPSMLDDSENEMKEQLGLFSETRFSSLDQNVEKSVIDMFGFIKEKDIVCSDLHFIGALHNFNLPLIKNSWVKTKQNLLELPQPISKI